MSNKSRTSRRRRIALGLGATGGGVLAAAFMPVGIALAAPTVVATDPGNFPTDTELSPDAFADLLGTSDAANAGASLADQQLNIDNPFLAAQIDYDIDNNIPFSFNTLDGIPATPAGYLAPDPATEGSATDLNPFTDAVVNTFGTSATSTQLSNAASYDWAVQHALSSTQVTQLDGIADGTVTTLSSGGTPTDAAGDPFLDAAQAIYGNNITATQTAEANYADYLLDTQNATYANQLDAAVEASIKAGTLSTTSTGGSATDADAFQDAFGYASGTADNATANAGTPFDSAPDLTQVATQLDPIVDTLGNPASLPDLDPGADFVSIFDPTAFTVNPLTGMDVANPTDFLATLAVGYDEFVNLIPGLAAPMDAWVDSFAASLAAFGL